MSSNLSLAPAVESIGAGASSDSTPEAFARAVLGVLARSDRRRMGQRGRRWVEATFSRHAVGARMVGLYTGLARRDESPR